MKRLSLRVRLTLAFAAGMLAVSIGVGTFVYVQVRRDLRDEVDLGLRGRAQALLAAGPRASLANTSGHLADNDESFAQLLDADGRVLDATRSVRTTALVRPASLPSGAAVFIDRTPPGLEPARLLVVPVPASGQRRYLVVGATLSDSREALARLLALFAVALPVALLASAAIGWLLAGAALRPLQRMSREAAAIAPEHPERLTVPAGDPGLALLAATVNSAVDRLQQAVERERGFVDAASHELRTPLTILRAEVDTALSAPRDAGELREALRSAAVEVEHLIRIAEGLLVLARAEQGQMPVERRPLVLRDLVDDCVRAFDTRAAAAGVTLTVTADDGAVMLDPTRVRQALDNLVENAIRHSPHGGRVSVVVRAGEEVTIEVCDDGPGFEPEVLARAFQPFNRGRAEGEGCGLGLTLAATMAEAHGGRAAAANRPTGGARVTLGFGAPIAAPAPAPVVR